MFGVKIMKRRFRLASCKIWGSSVFGKQMVIQFLYFSCAIFWMELVYHVNTYQSIDVNIAFPLLFSMEMGTLFAIVTGFFTPFINKLISVVLMVATTVFFIIQVVYKYIFTVPLLWGVAKDGAADVTRYWKEAFSGAWRNCPAILMLLVPLFLFIVLLCKRLTFKRHTWVCQGGLCLLVGILYFFPVGLIHLLGSESSLYDDYYVMTDYDLAAKQLGIFTTFRLDAQGVGRNSDLTELFGSLAVNSSTSQLENGSANGRDQEGARIANIMAIDFDSLIANETDDEIVALHKYFQSVTPTYQNEYTGMFEGKNLILITAESYSPWAVDETVTPILYKLNHEGFIFNNFYTALWPTSTSDGEYVVTQGLLPDGAHSFRRTVTNYLPFTIVSQFNRLGVNSVAYHNGSLSYYARNVTHTHMGYLFKAATLGAVSEEQGSDLVFDMEGANEWPASDYNMMVATMSDYIGEEPFHVYYMTISGHTNYRFDENQQSARNREVVESLPYGDEAKGYIAANVELDKALAFMLDRLEEAGVLENTVIAMSGDHYPYGLSKEAIDEIAGHTVDETFELYKNNFVLWCADMKDSIVVDKVGSSLDILPTLSNLFGFSYDSRLLSGRDLLSDAEGLAILKNKSFITDKIMYDTATKEVTYLIDPSEVSEEYIEAMQQEVKARFIAAGGILNKDYYRYLQDYLIFPQE